MKLTEVNIGADNGISLTFKFPFSERENLKPIISLMEKFNPEKSYNLEFSKALEKRSQDANGYAWVLIGKLSKVLGIPPIEVYREAIKDTSAFMIFQRRADKIEEFNRVWGSNGDGWFAEDMGECKAEHLKGYHNIKAWYGSSVYDTKTMSQLIDVLVEECKAQGIETLSPEKIRELEQSWA